MRYHTSIPFLVTLVLNILLIASCEDEPGSELIDIDLKDYFFSETCPDSTITEVQLIRYSIANGKPSDTSRVFYVTTCNEPSPDFYVLGIHELYYNFLPKSFTTLELSNNFGRINTKMDFYYPQNENVRNIDIPVDSDTFYTGYPGEFVINSDFTRKIEMDGDLDDMEDLKCMTKGKFLGFEDVTYHGKTYPAIMLEEKSVYETYVRGTLVEADRSTSRTYYAKGLGFVYGTADFWKSPDMRMELVATYTPEEFEKRKQAFFANPY